MIQHRAFLLAVTCFMLALAQSAGGESLNARSVVLNTSVSFPAPGGSQAVASPGVYRLEQETDALLRLVPSHGAAALVIAANRITHRIPVPEPIALTRLEGDTVLRIALLFPDGHGLEAVGTTARVGTRGE